MNDMMEEGRGAEELVELSPKLYADGLSAMDSDKKWDEEVKALLFIFHCYAEASPKPEEKEIAMALDLNTSLSRTAIACIVKCVGCIREIEATIEATSGSETPVEVMNRKMSNYGRVSNLKWRLGVAVASSTCKNLSAPYVSLAFDVTMSNGFKKRQTLELTYPEFQQFMRKLIQTEEAMSNS
tara:strand:+ start:291 stop:839 length:549 start_codon:yes stop_codon:yes gene_type:complete